MRRPTLASTLVAMRGVGWGAGGACGRSRRTASQPARARPCAQVRELLYKALHHPNRFVRETGHFTMCTVCAALRGPQLVAVAEEVAPRLADGMSDNWSQVRAQVHTCRPACMRNVQRPRVLCRWPVTEWRSGCGMPLPLAAAGWPPRRLHASFRLRGAACRCGTLRACRHASSSSPSAPRHASWSCRRCCRPCASTGEPHGHAARRALHAARPVAHVCRSLSWPAGFEP